MKALNATLLALLLGASASASAHSLWTQGENKDVFEADLIYGHEFPKPEVIPEARLVLFEAPQVISASGTQTLVHSGENYHYRHSAKLGKGTHVLLGTYKPTYWTKKADGKWAMAKTRADFPDAQSCGLYSMSGKSFVIIDDDGAFATKPLGKGYEITPLASPNDIKVGELAKFRVTLDGKPVADAKVVGSPAVFNSEEVEIEAFYGFDKPAPTRFVEMLGRYLRFDLGESFHYQQSVWSLIVQKLPVSISLGVWSFFIVYLVSIPLGIAKAVRDGSRFDLWTTTAILVGYAIPGFVLGVALLVLFGGGSFLSWFPLRGLTSDDWASLSLFGKVMDYFWHLALPLLCLVAGSFAVTTLLTKNVMLEEIRRQYVATARAKGLPERRILYRHVLRNALIPLVTGFPAAFVGAFFTGSLLIETLFSLDGLGLLSYESVVQRDYPVVLGMLYLFSLIGLLTKLITDIAYTWVDPRVKFSGSGR